MEAGCNYNGYWLWWWIIIIVILLFCCWGFPFGGYGFGGPGM